MLSPLLHQALPHLLRCVTWDLDNPTGMEEGNSRTNTTPCHAKQYLSILIPSAEEARRAVGRTQGGREWGRNGAVKIVGRCGCEGMARGFVPHRVYFLVQVANIATFFARTRWYNMDSGRRLLYAWETKETREMEREGVGAVSYTHLTLPTRRTV